MTMSLHISMLQQSSICAHFAFVNRERWARDLFNNYQNHLPLGNSREISTWLKERKKLNVEQKRKRIRYGIKTEKEKKGEKFSKYLLSLAVEAWINEPRVEERSMLNAIMVCLLVVLSNGIKSSIPLHLICLSSLFSERRSLVYNWFRVWLLLNNKLKEFFGTIC